MPKNVSASAEDRARWEMDTRPADVLALGSQVAFGSVGLNASVPMLAAGGLRVAALPTIVLSNLPHHQSVHAITTDPLWIEQALADLSRLGVADEVSTVCTGYFAAPEQVRVVARWLRGLVDARPEVRVVVDPTLGDDDVGPYTDLEVAKPLVADLLPLATGVTPNAFELRYLTSSESASSGRSQEGLVARARSLMGPRAQWAVVTNAGPQKETGSSANLVVTPAAQRPIRYRTIPSAAKGAGDILTAGIIRELHRGSDIFTATTRAARMVTDHLLARETNPPTTPTQES